MIVIKKEFNNGIEDCVLIDSDNNKKILETTNGIEWNNEIFIVKRRLGDYVESENDKEIDLPAEEGKQFTDKEVIVEETD